MRFVINGLIALMLLGLLSGVMFHRNLQLQEQQIREQARDDVRLMQREVMLQATLRKSDLTETGYPKAIDPTWFEDGVPANDLLSAALPWVEIAHEDHRRLEHPPLKVAAAQTTARFWYNPHNGRVRARVPASMSDAAALKLYNFINDSNVHTLFEDEQLSALDKR